MLFEKWTKKVSGKATNSAVEGIKETLNDKLDAYSGIIKIGLTIGVIIFGSIKINDHRQAQVQTQMPQSSSYYSNHGQPQPIIINNYITDGRNIPNGKQKQNRRKY